MALKEGPWRHQGVLKVKATKWAVALDDILIG